MGFKRVKLLIQQRDQRRFDPLQGLAPFAQAFDGQFHARAGTLAKAAIEHNADLVLHHYSRLLETCVACHSQYMLRPASRNWRNPGADDHAHHERDGT